MNFCEKNQRGVDLFLIDKSLRELFRTGRVFDIIEDDELPNLELKEVLFKGMVQFQIGELLWLELSEVITKKINTVVCSFLKKQRKVKSNQFVVIGMGSFGNMTMNFSSDCDLIFIVDNSVSDNNVDDLQKHFIDYLNRLNLLLKPFKVDCKLRPEGKSAQLVWSFKEYKKYINTRAKVWELQSFTKMRFVYGNEKLFKQITNAVFRRVGTTDINIIRNEIIQMKEQIEKQGQKSFQQLFDNYNSIKPTSEFDFKKGEGGLLTLDFALQYLILGSNKLFKKVLNQKFAERQVSICNNMQGEDEKRVLNSLFTNYEFLTKLIFHNQILFNSNKNQLPKAQDDNVRIAQEFGLSNESEFENKLKKVINSNKEIFKYILKL